MKRPTDKYNDPGPRTLRMLLVRGGLLLVLAAVMGTLAGWTKGVRATDSAKTPDTGIAARRIGSLGCSHAHQDRIFERQDACQQGNNAGNDLAHDSVV